MSASDKYGRLVDLLYERTQNKKIDWNAEDDGDVNTLIAGRRIRISSSRNSEGEPLEVVNILSGDWELIESFNDENLDGTPLPSSKFLTYWQLLSDLHETAHRQGLGADQAIDDIISELEDDVPF